MWMAELSERSGVPVATIKYYLREGLLPPGESVGATRSRYTATHVERLRLIRALVEVGKMRLADVRAVLLAVEDTGQAMHAVLDVAQGALTPDPGTPTDASIERVDALVEQLGWDVQPEGRNRYVLARALDALVDAGDPLPGDALVAYAEALGGLAEREVASIDADNAALAVHQIVVRTVLIDPVLLALRRMAHENVSARLMGG